MPQAPLTPLDIESRRFRRELFGYRKREVDRVLRAAADALSAANLRCEELERRVAELEKEVEGFHQRERTLLHALASSERLVEERKAQAQREAERILADARRQAEQVLSRTRAEVTRVEQQILRLKVERETFENRLLNLLDEHRRLVEIRRRESGLEARSPVPPPLAGGEGATRVEES